MLEKEIQNQILDYMNLIPGCLAYEIYNQAKYSRKLGRYLPTNKKYRPHGIPDIIAIYNGNTFWVEVKTETGKLSKEQKSTQEKMKFYGWRVYVARSIKDVQGIIKRQDPEVRIGPNP